MTARCFGRLSALFSVSVALLVYSISTASKGETAANSNQRSSGEQMTQPEAERSALEEFIKHNGSATIESYKFEKLIHVPDRRPDMALSGYFLCGQLAYVFAGKAYGPSRIMFNFSNERTLMIILYDDPVRGKHVASAVCDQAAAVVKNTSKGP